MKGIKTYLSVYPGIYKVIVLIIVPVSMLIIASTAGLITGESTANYHPELWIVGGIAVYSELFGEMFSIGTICSKKRTFGDFVLSSPKEKLFVKRFATVDVLRKIVLYPAICVLSQVILMLFGCPEPNIPEALIVGLATAAALNLGIMIYRNTSVMVMVMVVYLVMGAGWTVLVMPYIFATNTAVKCIFAVLTIAAAALTAFFGAKNVIRHTEGDKYD